LSNRSIDHFLSGHNNLMLITFREQKIYGTISINILSILILGGDRRDSSASGKFEEVKRFQFRPQGMTQRGGQIDPQHIQEKLKNLSNFYADESDVSADENDTSDNDDILEVSPEDYEVRAAARKTSL